MANILIASNFKTLVVASSSPLLPPAAGATTTQQLRPVLSTFWKPFTALSAATFALTAAPAMASEIEKAALFDFNLTLPAIALQFLLLMVALDKIYFTPLGKFMDERDAAIRASLSDVKGTSGEVKQLEERAAAVIKAARAEISSALNRMKKETTKELEAKLAEGRRKVEAELHEALQSLEKQKEDTIKALDSQIAALSDDIVKKVLPTI